MQKLYKRERQRNKETEGGGRIGLICEKVNLDCGISAPSPLHSLLSGDFILYPLSITLTLN